MLLLTSGIAVAGCNAALLSVPPQNTYPIVVTGASNIANGVLAHSTTITVKLQSSF